jgi:alpha-methylacyl-CoA racemase
VLDLAHYLPGPIASLMLSDMGAQVIKVVPPAGDGLRTVGPRDGNDQPIFYAAINEGKSELRLDLKQEADRVVLRDLIADSDVLIEGFRPGTLARLGFAAHALKELNPRLIVCSISSYGASGPLVAAAAHDANLLASGGIMARNDGFMIDPPMVDNAAALFAGLSITAALFHRLRNDGLGCTIDIGLSDVMMPLQAGHIAANARTGWSPKPRSYYLNGGIACYNQYRTADDRRVVLGALEEKFWKAFCHGANRPEWVARHADPEPQEELIREVRDFFAETTWPECEKGFRDIDCCLTLVVELDEAINHPQTRHRDLVRRHGDTVQALYPALIDGEPPRAREALKQVSADEARLAFRS